MVARQISARRCCSILVAVKFRTAETLCGRVEEFLACGQCRGYSAETCAKTVALDDAMKQRARLRLVIAAEFPLYQQSGVGITNDDVDSASSAARPLHFSGWSLGENFWSV